MMEHSRRRATGPWRHRTFLFWVAITAVVSLYLAVAAPFAENVHENFRWVALVVPPVSFMLMAVGLGWLVWLVTAKRTGRGADHSERVEGAHARSADDPATAADR